MATPKSFYGLTIDWGTLTTVTSSQLSAKTDGQYNFVIESMQLSVYLPADDTDLAYTTLGEVVNHTDNQNTFTALNSQRLDLQIGDDKMFRTPIRMANLSGNGRQPHYFITKPIIPAGESIFATLYNDSARSVTAQLLLEGYYVNKDLDRMRGGGRRRLAMR